ncbi:MAG TPA: cupin domain-containing protein [Sphingomicrobium sp.]|nr:cupin domain-containing protein [Sphingomicrobium sp.]
MNDPIDVADKFARFAEHWRPRTLAELNGQELKAVKIKGEFPWHRHDVDELFMVWRGRFRLEFRDRSVDLREGQLIVVPAGVEHRPVADEEAEIFLLEPIGTLNTGNVLDETYTAPNRISI